MCSPESQRIRATLINDRESLSIPIAVQRAEWEQVAARQPLPIDIDINPLTIDGMRAEWVCAAPLIPRQVVLWLHGGGFFAGSCLTHRDLAARIARASGACILLPEYRLAPEHPFPAALDDAVQAYAWLREQGVAPGHIILGGDSAGGGLALALLLRLRATGQALPAGAALLSPWVDLALTGATLTTHAARDPLCSAEGLQLAAHRYLGSANPRNPVVSPLYGKLHDLPPLFIQVGGDEVLLDDAQRLARYAREAGVPVVLEIWEGMWHVWHGWAAELPEARQAIERIGAWLLARRPHALLEAVV
ncbi:MAG: alpha/beta hydrolase [Chloroflexi bacterium]|nr:alpha/beta hydrolase [Chloroflexota bacterium]